MDTNIDFTAIVDSAKDGQWLVFAGLLCTLIAQIVRRLLPAMKKIPKRALPWVIFGITGLAAAGGILVAGGGWQAALIAGVSAGLMALGGYDLAKGPTDRLTRRRTAGGSAGSAKPAEPPAAPAEPTEVKP